MDELAELLGIVSIEVPPPKLMSTQYDFLQANNKGHHVHTSNTPQNQISGGVGGASST